MNHYSRKNEISNIKMGRLLETNLEFEIMSYGDPLLPQHTLVDSIKINS